MGIKDPALGRSRAQRALGEFYGKSTPAKLPLKKKRSTVNDIRHVGMGQYDGVKPSYGRYNVSEQSADILNRSLRNRGER
jgi:hypothetical protein